MRWLASGLARQLLTGGMVAGVAVAAVACSPEARTFQLVFPARHDAPLAIGQLPVSLVDHTGLVDALGQAPPGPIGIGWAEGAAAVLDNPTALVITWTGGACDQRVSMTSEGTAHALHVTIQTSRADGCRLLGVGRSVVLDLAQVVRPEDVSVSER